MSADDIKAIRQKAGLSQQQLSDQLGCRKATIVDWETGKKKISKAYEKILKIFAATLV